MFEYVTFVKAFHSIYLKPQPNDLKFINDKIPPLAILSVAVLLVICIIVGLCPDIVTSVFTQFLGGLV